MHKKGFQLSINMIVVIILGLALLGIGFSIFFNAYNQTVDIKERVDSQTQEQLNNLLDTGEAIVIPINSKEGKRGDFVDFDLGIVNEFKDTKQFFLYIRFSEYVGTGDASQVTQALRARPLMQNSCSKETDSKQTCADNWILFPKQSTGNFVAGTQSDYFNLLPNEKIAIPIRIVLPRKIAIDTNNNEAGLLLGQYIFNVDVYYVSDEGYPNQCSTSDDVRCPRYFSRKKIYVRVK